MLYSVIEEPLYFHIIFYIDTPYIRNVDDAFKKIVIVGNPILVEIDNNGITTMSVYDFLLKENSLEFRIGNEHSGILCRLLRSGVLPYHIQHTQSRHYASCRYFIIYLSCENTKR